MHNETYESDVTLLLGEGRCASLVSGSSHGWGWDRYCSGLGRTEVEGLVYSADVQRSILLKRLADWAVASGAHLDFAP